MYFTLGCSRRAHTARTTQTVIAEPATYGKSSDDDNTNVLFEFDTVSTRLSSLLFFVFLFFFCCGFLAMVTKNLSHCVFEIQQLQHCSSSCNLDYATTFYIIQ